MKKVLASGQTGVSRSRVKGTYWKAAAFLLLLGLLTHRFPAVWVLGHQAAREPCVVTVVLGQTGQFSVCQGAKQLFAHLGNGVTLTRGRA